MTGIPVLISPESAAGIKAGAKTGMSTVVCGVLFLLSSFFAPIFDAVPPAATAPILIGIGTRSLTPHPYCSHTLTYPCLRHSIVSECVEDRMEDSRGSCTGICCVVLHTIHILIGARSSYWLLHVCVDHYFYRRLECSLRLHTHEDGGGYAMQLIHCYQSILPYCIRQ